MHVPCTPRLEISRQILPHSALTPDKVTADYFPAISIPLPDLAKIAPELTLSPKLSHPDAHPRYSFSNDESPRNFAGTLARKLTPDYSQATHRVALLTGESSFAAALGQEMLPEDTILLLDVSGEQCNFMARYVHALRTRKTPAAWKKAMWLKPEIGAYACREHEQEMQRLEDQIAEWEQAGFAHALASQESYDKARAELAKKAVIIWRADLTCKWDMQELGDGLRAHKAHVTFANLTNVLACDSNLTTASQWADNLRRLPFTDSAPIILTSLQTKEDNYTAQALGPFWGLRNLHDFGGNTSPHLNPPHGEAVARQYANDPGLRSARRAGQSLSTVFGAVVIHSINIVRPGDGAER